MPGEIAVAPGEHEFYDFNAKYVESNAAFLGDLPADIPDEAIARVRELAAEASMLWGGGPQPGRLLLHARR